MLVADSSIWIDFLGGIVAPATDRLDKALAKDAVALVDLVATEVLQGMRQDRQVAQTIRLFDKLPVLDTGGLTFAIAAAGHYRLLRSIGVTVRKTIDTLIATRCIADGIPLLYGDRDFDPFVEHLGLISAMDAA